MKQNILRKLMLIVVLLTSSHAFAHDLYDYINGYYIYFNITDEINKTVEVTFEGNTSNSYEEYSGTVEIPSTISKYKSDGAGGNILITYNVTGIGQNAFEFCDELNKIIIPTSITTIKENAFSDCTQLKEVHIKDLSTWCKIDFNGVSNPLYQGAHLMLNGNYIRDLIIPNDITEIKKLAFHGCTQLQTISFSNSVTSIGKEAFQSCEGLYTLTIPKTIIKIDEAAFALCDLNFINVEEGNICYDSRDNCNAIIETATNTLVQGTNNTIIPSTITTIGNYAFCGTNLTSVTIPNSVTLIGTEAFNHCFNLKSVVMGANVRTIDKIAFSNCYNLETVHISDLSSWCKIDFKGVFSLYNYNLILKGNTIREMIIPNDITEIKDFAFENCKSLISVIIPNNVKKIGSRAFRNCKNLTSITIPQSITTFNNTVFDNCAKLSEIICESKTPPTIGSGTFLDIANAAILYVPVGSKEAYANATGWKNFTNIVEDDVKTGVESTLADDINISVENGKLVINGADNAKIEVYNINGQCVYNGTATTIPVNTKGLYIVKVGDTTQKVVL